MKNLSCIFFLSQFLTHVLEEGNFLDQLLGCKRSTYTRVNTVHIRQGQTH